MARGLSILLAALALATSVRAQNAQYVYFSTRFSETPTSGRGGHLNDLTAPTHPLVMGFGYVNEAAVLNSQGLAVVRPGVPNMTPISLQGCATPPLCPPPPPMVVDFLEIANFPQFNLECGDTNGNGLYNDTTSGSATGTQASMSGIDAVWIPFPPADRAAGLHDCFISVFGDAAGALGYRGTAITEADVFLLPKATNFYPLPSTATPPVFFIRQSHLETFFGMTAGSGSAIDVDGFCVDQATGDIYLSFDGSSASNPNPFTGTFFSAPAVQVTQAIHAGDVFRIPGTAYTPSGVHGIVTNPLPNLVERVYTHGDVTGMVVNAGGCITNTGSSSTGVLYTNSRGLSMDATSVGSTVTPQGFTVKQMFFTVDNRGTPSAGCPNSTPSNLTAAAIYSTQNAGSFAVINGTTMNQPSAAGMQDTSFNSGFFTGPLDAVCVVQLAAPYDPVAAGPFHLDNFPDAYYTLNGATPTPVLTGYIAGASPGGLVAILGRVDLQTVGGFIDRYSTAAFGIISGFPDLFIDVLDANGPSFLIAPYFLAPYGQNPAAQSLFNGGPSFADWNPIVTFSDPNVSPSANNGDSAFSMDLTPFVNNVPPIAFSFVVTFQALDLATLRLSDAISFEFN